MTFFHRKKIVSLLFIFSPSFLFASGLSERVQKTYAYTQDYKSQFIQSTHIEILDRDVKENGEMFFSKPGRFLIHYKGAHERKYICDGSTLWVVRPRDKDVEVFRNMKDLVSREALVFLGGLGDMEREFHVKEQSKHQLLLIPKNKKALFNKLLLTVDLESYYVTAVDLFPQSGNHSHYDFQKTIVNQSFSKNLFQYRP